MRWQSVDAIKRFNQEISKHFNILSDNVESAVIRLAENKEIWNICKPFKWDESHIHPLARIGNFVGRVSADYISSEWSTS